MKKKISFLFVYLLLALPVWAWRADGIEFSSSGGGNATVVKLSSGSYSGEIAIPETVEYSGSHYTVTAIGERAFYGCTQLTAVTIPATVTTIGDNAFYNCYGLKTVTFADGESDLNFGYVAFYNAPVETLYLGRNFISPNTTYGKESPFAYLKTLKNLTIGNSVTTLDKTAFQSCSGLTEVTIPASVTSIGNYAFSGCSGLKVVTIADSEDNLQFDSNAFYNAPVETLYIGRNFTCSSSDLSDQPFSFKPTITTLTIANTVTKIGDYAFRNCSGLTAVTILNSVTAIGESAFGCCYGLTAVTIPNSVTEIGDAVFEVCSGLTELTIGNSLTSISNHAFNECSGLTMVTIPNSVASIGDYAFCGCSGLTELTIPNSVTAIGNNAFKDCSGLTALNIGSAVTAIGDNAFCGCSGLTAVTIPNSVTSIGESVFEACSGLTEVTIGNSLTSISNSAFRDCSGLTEVTIPNSVASIGDDAFCGCSGLTEVAFPNSVTTIGSMAFYNCSALTAVTLGASMTSIDYSAFGGCSTLKTVTLADGEGNLQFSTRVFADAPIETLYVGRNFTCSSSDRSFQPFRDKTTIATLTVGNTVTKIGDNAFNGCTGLKTVTLADGQSELQFGSYVFDGAPVETIYLGRDISSSYQPFRGITTIATLTIGDSVTKIADNAFYGCSGLTEVDIPNSVTKIGDNAFYNCSGIVALTIGDSVATIGNYAFYGCSGLTEVAIPNSVTTIRSSAFCGCSGLTEVTISNSVTMIDNNAFYGCSALTEVTIPNSVTEIGDYAFKGCSGLKTVTLADGEGNIKFYSNVFDGAPVETLYLGRNIKRVSTYRPDQTFSGITTIATLTVGNSVTKIDEKAFYGCTGLKTVIIADCQSELQFGSYVFDGAPVETIYLGRDITADQPFSNITTIATLTVANTVTKIGNYAFDGCSALTSLTLGDSVATIGDYAFNGCSGLTAVTLPNTVTAIGTKAFYGCSKLATLTLGDSVAEIGNDAFYGCSKLTEVAIPNSVTKIGNNAFRYCSELATLTLGGSLTEIGEDAFDSCSKLTTVTIADGEGDLRFGSRVFNGAPIQTLYLGRDFSCPRVYNTSDYPFTGKKTIVSLTIGDSVTSIGNSAFNGCYGIASLTLGGSVAAIGKDAFNGCSKLTEVAIPNSVTTIGDNAFKGCSMLTEVAIPDSVTTIGDNAFNGCTNVVALSIGNSVTSIGASAFYGCKGITEVTIPGTVTKIGENAFNDCPAVKSVTLADGEGTLYYGSYVFGSAPIETLYVGRNFSYSAIYSSGTAFNGKSSILTLTISNSVTSIINHAFYGCSGLTELTIPASVATINDAAFSGCSGLRTVTLADSECNLQFGSNVFDGAPVETLYLGRDISSNQPFKGITTIATLTIGDSVTTIGENAFNGCSGLTEMTIGASVTSIGNYAFNGCSALADLLIPNSLTKIGKSAFSNCYMLAEVTIAEYAQPITLGTSVFDESPVSKLYVGRNCSNWSSLRLSSLKSLVLGNCVTEIPENAFKGCYSLADLTIGSGIAQIPESAFNGCSALSTVAIPANVTSIRNYAFKGSRLNGKIAIGCGVTRIGEGAFYSSAQPSSICVAAINAPQGFFDSFVYYDAPLYLPKGYVDYYHNNKPWEYFFDYNDPFEMIAIDNLSVSGPAGITDARAGETYQLSASFDPADASLPYVFWRSTNPDVATVDINGLVTIVDADPWDGTAMIIAETMYANGPVAGITVSTAGAADPTSLTLIDGVAYTRANALTDVNVVYKRNFNSTEWQGLCVPFNIAYEDWKNIALVAEPKEVADDNGNPVLMWETVTSGQLIGGHPYIIKPFATGPVEFVSENCDVLPANDMDDVVFEIGSSSLVISGTYAVKDDMATCGAYALSGGDFLPVSSNAVTLKPYRIFVTMSGISASKILNRVDGVDACINGILIDSEDDGVYYDMLGRGMLSPGRGVYIHKGQKVMIK